MSTEQIRTIVEFSGKDGATIVNTDHAIPNVVVGQNFTFDHLTSGCLHGVVTNIQHVVFLNPSKAPQTYIDVDVSPQAQVRRPY